jgi:AraC-like DNA-binding protein
MMNPTTDIHIPKPQLVSGVVKLALQGVSVPRIAERLFLDEKEVSRIINAELTLPGKNPDTPRAHKVTPWTVEQLIDRYLDCDLTQPEIAQEFGIDVNTLRRHLHEHGVTRPRHDKRRPWTDEERAYILDHYPAWTYQQIADDLDRTKQAVMTEARKLRKERKGK